jgi:hypothetical protein
VIFVISIKTNKGFITVLFIIAPKQKISKCLSAVELINRIRYIHTMEYYSAIKRSEVLILLLG